MKRINIYIKEDEDKIINHLSEILGSNRSEIIRLSIREFADNRQSELDEFLVGLVDDDVDDIKKLEKERITLTQLSFIRDCMNDPVFFAEKAIEYNTFDQGYTNIQLYDFQKELLSELNHRKRVIVNKSRQIGGTMVALMNIAHYVTFNPDKVVVITSNKQASANELLNKLRNMLESLPEFMQPKMIERNVKQIRLENGCNIVARPTSANCMRGFTVNYLFMDELAFAKKSHIDEFIAAIFPTMAAGTTSKIHLISSPNGPNHFMKMFSDAICNYSDYYAIELPYDVMPGRDDEWKENTIKQIGLERFQQEFECKFIYRRGIED